jgi:type I restriction enzyme S subunit
VIDPRYLYYLIIGPQFQAEANSAKTGSAQPFMSLQQLRGHTIRFEEDLPTQRRIASILSAYDDLIENNTRRIQILEEMAQAIYREWFIEFRFPGHEGVQIVNSELGPIPEGWLWTQLGDHVREMRIGVEPSSVPSDTPYFGLEHLPERSIAIREWGRASDATSRKYRFESGDILFGKIRPYFHKVGIPPVTGICSTDAIVIRPNNREVAGLTLAVVSSSPFVQHAVQTSQGTKMPRANWSVLERYPVAIPRDESVLHTLNAFILDVMSLIHKLVLANRNLAETRDLLLPRLISGEIDVSTLDIGNSEPAA